MKLVQQYRRPLLIFIVFLAFALRVHHLDSFGFWQDEGLTSLRASYSVQEILSNRITIQEGITKDTHPPLYYLAAHFGKDLWGASDFSYRFISVLAGILLVPLLYQMGRRINGPAVGLLAALLAAINPLQIWYAQEARMYTMLVLLGAAATYVLWRTITAKDLSSSDLVGRMALYFLLAGLAFYTHYTAVFLIAVQSLFWIWLLWRRGLRWLIIGGAVAAVLAAIPLVPVTIPRLFTGAETAYHYVPPWIMLQDVIQGFGQGITSNFDDLGIKILDLAMLFLLIVGIVGVQKIEVNRRLSSLFLLVYLLAAVLGLMAGSLLKPMYLGVRHIIIGSPAFLLLLSRGVTALPRKPAYLPQALALTLIVGGSFISLSNLYYDPAFAKDDARALVNHIESRAGNNDIVLYNNAILLPLHEHYQSRSDLPVTAIPVYPYMANQGVGDQLVDLSQDYDRIWFVVDSPIDGRDDRKLVEGWLNENLPSLEAAGFWGVSMLNRVVAYDARPVYLDALPEEAVPAQSDWEEVPLLAGYGTPSESIAMPTMWVDLYWRNDQPAHEDFQLRFILRDVEGKDWVDQSYPFRTALFNLSPDGSLTRMNYGLNIPAGLPPGEYELLVQPWREIDGQSLGSWQSLGQMQVASSDQWTVDVAWPYAGSAPLRFDEAASLLGVIPVTEEVRPGHPLPLSLYWQAAAEGNIQDDLQYDVEVITPDGTVVHSHTGTVGPEWLNVEQWPDKAVILQQDGIYIPPESETGTYRLRWRLRSGDQIIPGRVSPRLWSSESNILGSITVEPWPLSTTLPEAENIIEAPFGSNILLYGYDLEPDGADLGKTLDVTLYWQAEDVPEDSYFVFVHLINAETGEIAAQSDKIPVDWLRPTSGWRRGEVLTDPHRLNIPADIEPGDYSLYVGLYN
ncbi:MAG: glycosyltransferase family 39 protein, partial [Candidatus Promineifilaceae bacterium]